MDRKQAVTILKRKTTIPGDGYTWEQINEAIDMAISALSPPNEPPSCYQPDGDGCAYQCYDGDDEPIDKCKECPLCYSDKQRHHTPPNEPLTLDELREMSGEPVWIVEQPDWGHWELSADAEDYLADRDQDFYGLKHDDPAGRYGLHVLGWLAYRRPPEGEA